MATHIQQAAAGKLADPTPARDYCNALAAQLGLDPAGYAGSFDDAVVIETPLPWRKRMYEQAGALPQAMIDLLEIWLAEYHTGKPYRHRPLFIAPDPAAPADGLRTVMFFTRPQQPFARFVKTEYRVPDQVLGPLLWAWYMAPEQVATFACYRRTAHEQMRDILVCTHGAVDVVCAKFGYPLYQTLRNTSHDDQTTRVWRVSHFGGHVFAPTLMDMPSGHYWAYVGETQAAQIIARTGDVTALRGHYRGWAGLSNGLVQAAERALWQAVGWDWFGFAKHGEIIEQETDRDEPHWATARIAYTTPTGDTGAYKVRVQVSHTIATVPSTGSDAPHAYAQYEVTEFTHQTHAPVTHPASHT